MGRKSIAAVGLAVACCAVAGGWTVEHRGYTSPTSAVPVQAQEVPVWQLGPAPAPSVGSLDVFSSGSVGSPSEAAKRGR